METSFTLSKLLFHSGTSPQWPDFEIGLEYAAKVIECRIVPQPIAPDLKKLAEALFLQGLRVDQIIKQTSVKRKTLETWITRYGWRDTFRKAELARAGNQEANQAVVNVGVSASKRAQEALGERIALQAEVLGQQRPPRTRAEVLRDAEAMRPVVQNAKDTFQWGEGAHGGDVVNIAFLSTATPVPADSAPTPVQAPPIDVESSPATPE